MEKDFNIGDSALANMTDLSSAFKRASNGYDKFANLDLGEALEKVHTGPGPQFRV